MWKILGNATAGGMGGGGVGRVGSGLTAQKYLLLVLHGYYFSTNKCYIGKLVYTCRLRIYVIHGVYSCLSGVISSESPKMDFEVQITLSTYSMVI